MKQIADMCQLELIDIRLSTIAPEDFSGLPGLDIQNNIAKWIPMDVFPLQNAILPKGKRGWLIFLDEINGGAPMVMKAAYRFLLDKEVGQHKLHDKVYITAAGNLSTDGAMVNRMGTALDSRLIHVVLGTDFKAWLKWASSNKIDHRIISFISRNPKNLHVFNPNKNDMTFCCPRTLEFLSKLIINIPTDKLFDYDALITGTIGKGIAQEFIASTEVYSQMPEYKDIIADPLYTDIPNDPAILFAMAYMISAYLQEDDIDKIMIYIKRMDVEFQTICLKDAIRRNTNLIKNKTIKRWGLDIGQEVM